MDQVDLSGSHPLLSTPSSTKFKRGRKRMLNRFGGMRPRRCVVGLSRIQLLADVGFKLRECEVRLRRKIFSVAESRSRVVVTALPEDPKLPLMRGAILCRTLAIVNATRLREDMGPPAGQVRDDAAKWIAGPWRVYGYRPQRRAHIGTQMLYGHEVGQLTRWDRSREALRTLLSNRKRHLSGFKAPFTARQ
jgi:hypothetical protein